MGGTKTLGQIIEGLDFLTDDEAICAVKPWSMNSEAIVIQYSDDDELPEEMDDPTMIPFLEVAIMREVVEGFKHNEGENVTLEEICNRVIYYVINDA